MADDSAVHLADGSVAPMVPWRVACLVASLAVRTVGLLVGQKAYQRAVHSVALMVEYLAALTAGHSAGPMGILMAAHWADN